MIRRHELSDVEWEYVRPLLPVSLRGRKRLDDTYEGASEIHTLVVGQALTCQAAYR